MIILRAIYYFFEIFILLFKNFKNKNFLILTPRFFSILIKKVFILNLNNKNFFSQNVRNFYDINTVYQVFGYEEYDLRSDNKEARSNVGYAISHLKGLLHKNPNPSPFEIIDAIDDGWDESYYEFSYAQEREMEEEDY